MRPPNVRGPAHTGDAAEDGAGRGTIYDSFVVKVWRDTGSPDLRRAEVQHLQTELTESARDVDMEWLHLTLFSFLGISAGSGPRDHPDSRSGG